MLVWFRPLTRHRPAQYAPKRSMATQGVSQRTKRGVEQRRTPRVMNSLSICWNIWLATGGLPGGSRAGRTGDFAYPVFLGVVIDLGIGPERFQHAETVGLVSALGGFGGRVVEVAETDGAVGAGFHAGRDVIRGVDFGLTVGRSLGLGGVPAAVAEVAFFDHAAHARGDVRVEGFFHAGRPGRIPPVEVAGVVGAGGHTVAATEAALGHLADDSGGGVDI